MRETMSPEIAAWFAKEAEEDALAQKEAREFLIENARNIDDFIVAYTAP